MARLKNSTSKTNRIFFIFSPIVYDINNVLVLMFFLKSELYPYVIYVAEKSINAETAKPRIQAYEMLEDITSIIACQEKSYAFPMPFAVTALNAMTPMIF